MIDERAIYEWLRGVEVQKGINGYRGKYEADDCRPIWVTLPPLDMNTAFSECIPKLKEEGVNLYFDSKDNAWDSMYGEYQGPDFYVALTEYLKEKA